MFLHHNSSFSASAGSSSESSSSAFPCWDEGGGKFRSVHAEVEWSLPHPIRKARETKRVMSIGDREYLVRLSDTEPVSFNDNTLLRGLAIWVYGQSNRRKRSWTDIGSGRAIVSKHSRSRLFQHSFDRNAGTQEGFRREATPNG